MKYNVQFDYRGEAKSKYIEASSVGAAFQQVLNKYPGCVLIRATLSRILAGKAMWLDYLPPPNLRKVAIRHYKQEKAEQTEMLLQDEKTKVPTS